MHRFLFVLFLVFSCTQPEKATDNNIINREQFTKLVVDIHLIEAKFETIKFKNELNAKAILQNDYDSIFSLYGITFENFESSSAQSKAESPPPNIEIFLFLNSSLFLTE